MNPYPFLSELFLRLQMESPAFFRKLQLIFYPLAGVAQLFTGLRDIGFVFPASVTPLLSQSSALILFFAGVLSTLPVKDCDKLDERVAKKCRKRFDCLPNIR